MSLENNPFQDPSLPQAFEFDGLGSLLAARGSFGYRLAGNGYELTRRIRHGPNRDYGHIDAKQK